VSAPIFGPNVWQAIVQPVAGGGIPPNLTHVEIKLTFKEGGAFDFHTNFERIKERFQQAVEAAGVSNVTGGSFNQGPVAGVNMDAVHLDELPTYQDSGLDALAPQPAPPPPPSRPTVQPEDPAPSFEEVVEGRAPVQRQSHNPPPTDAPPGYEEAQQQSIEQEFEARLAKDS
jgi:WW domain-binding protein 2